MAKCFCGCGRRLPTGTRALRKAGKRSSKLVAKLKQERAVVTGKPADETPHETGIATNYDFAIMKGDRFVREVKRILHGEGGALDSGGILRMEYDEFAEFANDALSEGVQVKE